MFLGSCLNNCSPEEANSFLREKFATKEKYLNRLVKEMDFLTTHEYFSDELMGRVYFDSIFDKDMSLNKMKQDAEVETIYSNKQSQLHLSFGYCSASATNLIYSTVPVEEINKPRIQVFKLKTNWYGEILFP